MRKRFSAALLAAFIFLGSVPYQTTAAPGDPEDLIFKEPNWAVLEEGRNYGGAAETPPFDTATMMVGVHSSVYSQEQDYKQPQTSFVKTAFSWHAQNAIETFYTANPTTSISYAERYGENPEGGALLQSGIAAYSSYEATPALSSDIAHGQWLINNNFFSRFNANVTFYKDDRVLRFEKLNQAPWGVANSNDPARRDEFLVTLSKILYGVTDSRAVYFEHDAYRWAKPVVWERKYSHTVDEDGRCTCRFQGWIYRTDVAVPGIDPGTGNSDGFTYRNVTSYRNQQNIINRSKPIEFTKTRCPGSSCSCKEQYFFMGEYVYQSEQANATMMHSFGEDAQAYVTSDVWELYLYRLVSEGLIDYNEFFSTQSDKNRTIDQAVGNVGPPGDQFSLRDDIAVTMKNEYNNYGKQAQNMEAPTTDVLTPGYGPILFPQYAPELGIVRASDLAGSAYLGSQSFNSSSNKVGVLGRNYRVYEDRVEFVGDAKTGLPTVPFGEEDDTGTGYMQDQTMTNMSALRLIERAMRVNEKNLSALEASIISQKYGAKYLDNVPDEDRATVEYLIAMGVIDFENYKEYANLYNVLNREFAFELLYRLANPAARTDFSKLLLTDASTAALNLPDSYRNYQNSIATNASGSLDRYIDESGVMRYEPAQREPVIDDAWKPETVITDTMYNVSGSPPASSTANKELSVLSNFDIERTETSDGSPISKVYILMDDPVKYLYRDMPIATFAVSANNKNIVDSKQIMYLTNQPSLRNKDGILISAAEANNRIYYLPHLYNMVGARNPEMKKRIDDAYIAATDGNANSLFSLDGYRMINPAAPNNPLVLKSAVGSNTYYNVADNIVLKDTVGKDLTGIESIEYLPQQNRFRVSFQINARDAKSAEEFVRANLTPLTSGLVQTKKEVGSVVTANGTVMTDASNKDLLGSGNNVNGSYIGSNTVVSDSIAIAGNTIAKDDIKVAVGDTVMISQSLSQAINQFSATDKAGDQPVVAVAASNLGAANTRVADTSALQPVAIAIREFVARQIVPDSTEVIVPNDPVSSQKQYNDLELGKYYDVTLAGSGNVFTHTYKAGYTPENNPSKYTKREVDVTVVLELIPELPTLLEQHSLVGTDLDVSLSRTDLNNWMYTRPTNPQLAEYWDYNLSVVNAIIKTMGNDTLQIRSGFVYPKLTFLIDAPPLGDGNPSLNMVSAEWLAGDFMIKVGEKLPLDTWVTPYIGSRAAYNQRIAGMGASDEASYRESGLLSLDGNVRIFNGQNVKTLKTRVGSYMPLWAEVYFKSDPFADSVKTNFIHTRLSLPFVQVHPIAGYDGASRLYGLIPVPTGVGEVSAGVNIPFVKNDMGHLFLNLDQSSFIYNETGNSLSTSKVSMDKKAAVGTKLEFRGTNWFVKEETDSYIRLVADAFLQAEAVGSEVVELQSRLELLAASQAYVGTSFKHDLDPYVHIDQTYHFSPFDTSLPDEKYAGSFKVLEVENAILKPFFYVGKNGVFTRTESNVATGEILLHRPFVTLNKAAWATNISKGTIEWQKRYLGADYNFYNAENNLLLMMADVLPDAAENLVSYADLGAGTLQVGALTGTKLEDGSFLVIVPFSHDMLLDEKTVSTEAIRRYFASNSIAVVSQDGSVFQTADYTGALAVSEFTAEYTDFDSTAIIKNGELFVATGGKVERYVSSSQLKSIAVRTVISEDVNFLVIKDTAENLVRAALHAKQIDPPAQKMAAEEINQLQTRIVSGVDFTGIKQVYSGLEGAKTFANELLDYTARLRTETLLGKIIWLLLFLSIALSVTLVIARTIKLPIPFMLSWITDIWESTGIDILRLMSLSIVNCEEEPPRWGTVMIYSFLLVFVPALVLALMQGFNIRLL